MAPRARLSKTLVSSAALLVAIALALIITPVGLKAAAQTTSIGYVSYPGSGVALCYPYLVETHGLLDLENGVYVELWPAYVALTAVCAKDNMTVVTTGGVYFISKGKVEWTSFISMSNVIGVAVNYVGLLANEDVIAVSPSGLAQVISSPPNLTPMSFTAIGSVPVAVFGKRNAPYVYIATPYANARISVGGNVTTAMASGPYLVLSWIRGNESFISEYQISPTPLSLTPVANWTAPVPLTWIYNLMNGYLLGSYDGLTVVLGLSPSSPTASLVFIGAAEPTPIGYYAGGYTYVMYNGSWTPVPGYAFSFLARSAVLTDVNNVTLIYPLQPAELELGVPVSGYLYVGNATLYVSLQPGDYELPSGSQLRSPGGVAVSVEPPSAVYPRGLSPLRLASEAIVINGQVDPVVTITGVNQVSSGDGALLAVGPQQAVVFTPPSGLTVIPAAQGSWTSGGIGGPLVALYSSLSSSVYVYSLDGSLVTSYPVAWATAPTYIFTYMEGLEPYVVAEWTSGGATPSARYSVVGPSGVLAAGSGTAFIYDYSTGLRAIIASPTNVTLELGGFVSKVSAYNDEVYVNGLEVSLANSSESFYVANLTTGSELTVISGPLTQVVPLPDNMIAVYSPSSKVVNIYNLGYLEAQLPAVVVNGPPSSIVIVNGTPVGHPPAVIYAPYFTTINVSLQLPGDQGDSFGKVVEVVAPYQEVNVTPPPDAELVFNVSSPVPVSSLEVSVNGTTYSILPGSSVNVTPGYTYVVTAENFEPYKDCAPTITFVTPSVGMNYVNITCHLFRPVLELLSSVRAETTIIGPSGFRTAVNLTPGVASYVVVPLAELSVNVEPLISGYAPESLYVNATAPSLYFVNATPRKVVTTTTTTPSYGTLSVTASISTASIFIYSSNGTLVRSGVGSLTTTLGPGIYLVKAESSGYSWNTTVQVTPGSVISLNAILTSTVTPSRSVSHSTATIAIAVVIVAVVAALAWLFMSRRAKQGGAGTPQI